MKKSRTKEIRYGSIPDFFNKEFDRTIYGKRFMMALNWSKQCNIIEQLNNYNLRLQFSETDRIYIRYYLDREKLRVLFYSLNINQLWDPVYAGEFSLDLNSYLEFLFRIYDICEVVDKTKFTIEKKNRKEKL